MRVNVEDSVRRHLPRLAKEMGWSMREALGALAMVYNSTQAAGIYEDTPARIATVIVLDFDDDEQADKFVTAMIASQLAVMLSDGRVRIRGNQERISELNEWYQQKVDAGRRGGKETQRRRKSSMVSEATSSESEANLKRNQPVLSPMSFVLSPNTEENTNTEILPTTKPKRTKKPSSGVSPSDGKGRTIPFREAWKAAYRSKLGTDAAWGNRESGQAATLLGSYTSDELVALVPYFFAWKRPEVIRGGYSFGKGPACFVLKIDELRADMADADRRRLAAQIQERENLADTLAKDDDSVARINAIIAKEQADARRVAEETRRTMEPASPAAPRALEQGNQAPGRGLQSAHERPSGDNVVQGASAVCDWIDPLESIGRVLRTGSYAKHSPGESVAGGEARGLEAAAGPNAGGEAPQ